MATVCGRRAALAIALLTLVGRLLCMRALMQRQVNTLAEAPAAVGPFTQERQLVCVYKHMYVTLTRGEKCCVALGELAFVRFDFFVDAQQVCGEIRLLCKEPTAVLALVWLVPAR